MYFNLTSFLGNFFSAVRENVDICALHYYNAVKIVFLSVLIDSLAAQCRLEQYDNH
jgi:hypothetical protein